MNGRNPEDEFERRVREGLQRDSEQIRPDSDGLQRIRERTTVGQPSGGRRWLTAGAVALATAAAVTGAFFVSSDLLDQSAAPGPVATPTVRAETDNSASPTPTTSPSAPASSSSSPSSPPSSPAPTQEPTTTSTPSQSTPPPSPSAPAPAPATEQTVPVYYLGETSAGLRLFREFHRVESADSEAVTALNEMFGSMPRDPDYSSPWAPGSRALSVQVDDSQITVDLSSAVLGTSVPQETAELMLQQLVYTVQAALQAPSAPVQLLVDGEPVSEISGSPTVDRLPRAPAADVQALTWIISPTQGATVPGTFEVTGVANSFEANVGWELVQSGQVVDEGFATAAEGMTFSEYSFTVESVPPGDYTLRVFQTSAEDGSEEFVDTKDIAVQ